MKLTPPPPLMASYALRLIALALVGGTLLFANSATHSQTACSFSGTAVRAQTYIAGTAIASPGANLPITFPTATGSGCTTPIVYTLTPVATAGSTGTSVPGLTFNGSATPPTLTGTPTAPAGYSDTHVLAYTATDANGDTATVQYRITVEADSTPTFARTEYAQTFYVDRYEVWGTPQVDGGNYFGTGGSQYSIAVPDGEMANYWANGPLRHIANAHQMTALPTATAAETSHVFTFTDRDGDVATTMLKFKVEDAPSPDFFRDSIRVNWILNSIPRNDSPLTFDGAGGTGTTYALSGTLPAGLTFDAAQRRVTGRPTEAGTFALTLTATDSNGASDTQAVSIFVSPTTDPSTAPAFAGRSVLSCTEVRVHWGAPRGGNPPEAGFTLPTVTGYRIEGKQRGVDSDWKLIAETGAAATSYTHSDLPPGSQWTYRVRAITAGGVNPWSPNVHASTSVNPSRPYRALEVGMTISVSYPTARGGEITRFEWYRSPDQAPLDWQRAPGGPAGFYDVTDADVGHLIGVAFPGEEYVAWVHAVTSQVTVIQSFAGVYDPVIPDDSPSFAASGERIVEPPASVNIQLPTATGGSGTIVYALSPDLPAGLVFDEDALTVTGTPPPDWTGDYAFTARDDDCDIATYTLAIGPEPIILEPEPESPAPFVPATRYGAVTVTVAEEGNAPEDAVYGVRLACGPSAFTPALAAGESYTASVVAGSLCALSVTDRQGASEVRGEFAGRLIGEGSSAATVTLVHEAPEERLEATLVAGLTFVRWRGEETPVAEAVAELTLRVTAVHQWDVATQSWRSWSPGGEAIPGMNTLAAFEPGGIYFIFAEAGTDAAN